MRRLYLIDGYNLLYAMGALRGRTGPTGLEKARRRLLGLLRGGFGDDAPNVTVVFDAAGAPPGVPEEQDFRGLHVHYAIRQEQADDLIELLISKSSSPRQLTVVSDDHRIQQAARRRHCLVQRCGDFLDWLDRRRQQSRPAPPPRSEKETGASPRETERWLKEFGDLDADGELRELFDSYGFTMPEE